MAPRFLSEGDWSFVIILAGSFLAGVWRFMTRKFHETRARLMNEEHERAEQLAEERRPYLGAAQVEVEKLLNPLWEPPALERDPVEVREDVFAKLMAKQQEMVKLKRIETRLRLRAERHDPDAEAYDPARNAYDPSGLANDPWKTNQSPLLLANRKPS